jgi:hypothetical protein
MQGAIAEEHNVQERLSVTLLIGDKPLFSRQLRQGDA